MAGGTITRIALGSSSTIIDGNFTGHYEKLDMNAGMNNAFKAKVTNHGNPKDPPPAGKYFVKGWWTDENDKEIKEAVIGDTIRFHLQTQKIPDGKDVIFTVYDWDGLQFMNDKLTLTDKGTNQESTKIKIQGNKGYIEWKTGEGTQSLLEENLEGDEIELFVECIYDDEKLDLPEEESNYLIVKEKEEVITVLIELPHSGYTDKLNRKGLGGHTAIMIGDEYYDYGPQPGEGSDVYTDGRPWWDKMNSTGNLTKKDMMGILNREFPNQQEINDYVAYYKKNGKTGDFPITNRYSLSVVGRVCLIDIHVKGSEKNKLEKWWKNKYQDLGNYSVWILFGEQCTTTVKISIEESTGVFSTLDITSTTQTPEGFLELLTEGGEHTYGSKKNTTLTITTEFRELPSIEVGNFEADLNIRLGN